MFIGQRRGLRSLFLKRNGEALAGIALADEACAGSELFKHLAAAAVVFHQALAQAAVQAGEVVADASGSRRAVRRPCG